MLKSKLNTIYGNNSEINEYEQNLHYENLKKIINKLKKEKKILIKEIKKYRNQAESSSSSSRIPPLDITKENEPMIENNSIEAEISDTISAESDSSSSNTDNNNNEKINVPPQPPTNNSKYIKKKYKKNKKSIPVVTNDTIWSSKGSNNIDHAVISKVQKRKKRESTIEKTSQWLFS